MMKIPFTKMHGLGNDFMVVDNTNNTIKLTPEIIQLFADRHFGIGFDQLLLVEKATDKQADFFFRIYNADGSKAEQCGNGARCFARFIRENKLSDKKTLLLQTETGLIETVGLDDENVQVTMSKPDFTPEAIPFLTDKMANHYSLTIEKQTVIAHVLSMGNPHCVIAVDDIKKAPVELIGKALQNHPQFPKQVNVGFMQIADKHSILLRVYERGSGETLACGSGACAAVVAGIQRGSLQSPVNVNLPGGTLNISWQGNNTPVLMTGPATTVYTGTCEL